MNYANHRTQVDALLEEWSNNQDEAKNIISCLVEFLIGDETWLDENISRSDRSALKSAINRLKTR